MKNGYGGTPGMPKPAAVPGRLMAVSPGYGAEAKAVLVPEESSWAWADGPPPSTGESVSGALRMVTVIRVPSAAAVAVNAPPSAAPAPEARAPNPRRTRPPTTASQHTIGRPPLALIVELYNDSARAQ